MKIVIRVLLGVAVVFMAFICVKSVVTPIQFEAERATRETQVIANLVSLRTAEAQFRLDKGYFTADLDSLIDYLETAPKKEVLKEGSLSEKQLENGMTETKAAKILERARIKAQRKMNFQGPDSLNQLYNYVWNNDREVKAEGLQGFRRDTILTNMIQSLYKGQYTEENIGEIIYIPHTDNVKFEVETNNGYTTSQGIKVPIFEIRAHYNTYLHDLNNQERVNLIDKEVISADISKAKSMNADVIIACMHWGTEYTSLPPKEIVEFSEWLLAEGVNHIIGNHPHVIQPIEIRENPETPDRHAVIYSTGNLVSNMSLRGTDGGIMVKMQLKKVLNYTRLASLEYLLTWIAPAHDGKRDFTILPARGTIPGNEKAKQKLRTFLSDTEQLFNRHNKGEIKEFTIVNVFKH